MIVETHVKKPDYSITNMEYDVLKQVIQANPLYEHGVSRANPTMYRQLVALQTHGLIGRRGYKYYPTRFGWLLFINTRERLRNQTQETLAKEPSLKVTGEQDGKNNV